MPKMGPPVDRPSPVETHDHPRRKLVFLGQLAGKVLHHVRSEEVELHVCKIMALHRLSLAHRTPSFAVRSAIPATASGRYRITIALRIDIPIPTFAAIVSDAGHAHRRRWAHSNTARSHINRLAVQWVAAFRRHFLSWHIIREGRTELL